MEIQKMSRQWVINQLSPTVVCDASQASPRLAHIRRGLRGPRPHRAESIPRPMGAYTGPDLQTYVKIGSERPRIDRMNANESKPMRRESRIRGGGPVVIGTLITCLTYSAPPVAAQGAAESAEAPPSSEETAASERTSEISEGQVRLEEVATLQEALAAISRDSGIEFQHRSDESVPVEPVPGPLTFWRALDHILDQVDMDVDEYAGDRQTMRLVRRPDDRPSRVDAAIYSGVYRIEPMAVTARRDFSRGQLSSLQVSLQIAWEPRLTPIGLMVPIDRIGGEFDDGTALVPQRSGGSIEVATTQAISSTEFFLPLKLPDTNAQMIRQLEGRLRAMLPGKRGRFELSLGDPTAKQTIDDMTVQIEGVRKAGSLTEVRLGIELEDAGRSLESHRQWIFENEAFVRRADDTDARHLGMEVYRQTLSGVGVGYLFDLGDALGELKLLYESPTSVEESEVTFVLRDIPLP